MSRIDVVVGSEAPVDVDVEVVPVSPVQQIRIGLLGLGHVGQAFTQLVESRRSACRDLGFDPKCHAALVRDSIKSRPAPHVSVVVDPGEIFEADVDVIVEVLGGVEPARTLVARALRAGIPVVSANKSLIAAHGHELRALAVAHHTSLLYDAAVVAGVPFLGALTRRPTIAALRSVSGVINGTSHFIVSELARGASFASALAEAQRRGCAEPDSDADVSGRDAAEKLAILLHLGGVRDVAAADLPRVGIDAIGPNDLSAAKRLGGTIKPVAMASLEPHFAGAWVGPAFVCGRHPFAALNGVDNAVQWTADAGPTVTFAGPGAGPDVTAVTLLDDVIEATFSQNHAATFGATTSSAPVAAALTRPPSGGWFIRLRGAGTWRATDLDAALTSRHLPALRILSSAGEWFVRTTNAPWSQVRYVLTGLRARGADVAAFPVLE